MSPRLSLTMRDLREMSFDDALDAHALLDSFDDAEEAAYAKAREARE